MPISGTTKGKSFARLGVMRMGATRYDYYQPWVKVYVNGTLRQPRIVGATITQALDSTPDTGRFRLSGFTPVKGQDFKVYLGDLDLAHLLFAGHILQTTQTYEADKPANVVWDVSCIDYTWLLNRRKPIKKYTSQSATAIILDLMASFTSGFTTVNVEAGLATLDEISFTNDEMSDALDRICERIGGYWYIDFNKDLHVFLSNTETAGAITQTAPRTGRAFAETIDLSQVRTRVFVRGGGSNAGADLSVGFTTLPVEDGSWYSGSGGTVECGPQRITHTGVAGTSGAGANTGFVQPPTTTQFSIGTGNGAIGGTNLTAGTYWVGAAFTTVEGETTIGALTQITVGAGDNEAFITRSVDPSDPKVSGVRFYIGTNGGAQSTMKAWRSGSAAGEPDTFPVTGSTTYEVKAANAANRGPLTTSTAGVSAEATAAGATSLAVDDLSIFGSSGWAEAPGSQRFRYTGRSASSGAGTLTGIPASGIGSLTAPVRAGTVKVMPHLTGIPGSGAGSILYAINMGDQVNVLVQRDDTTAQTNMAGFTGGDGIVEHFLSDGRWSIAECQVRGDAELTQDKDPRSTVTFETRDQTVRVGRTISFTLSSPSINSTQKIQTVTLSDIAVSGGLMRAFPLRSVDSSSRRFSFEDLVRQIRSRAA